MAIHYELVNRTKQERVSFFRIGAGTARELAGHPATAAITTWYLLHNSGDEILFLNDTDGSLEAYSSLPDATDRVIQQLIDNHILVDEGKEYLFNDEPEIYLRKLKNVWFS